MVTHITVSPDGTRLTIRVEIRRRRILDATMPRDVQPLELSAFLEQVRKVIARKWRGEGPA